MNLKEMVELRRIEEVRQHYILQSFTYGRKLLSLKEYDQKACNKLVHDYTKLFRNYQKSQRSPVNKHKKSKSMVWHLIGNWYKILLFQNFDILDNRKSLFPNGTMHDYLASSKLINAEKQNYENKTGKSKYVTLNVDQRESVSSNSGYDSYDDKIGNTQVI